MGYRGSGALSVILLIPLLITDVPPGYWTTRTIWLDSSCSPLAPVTRCIGPIFTPEWTVIPNLAGDAVGLSLLRLLPIHVVGWCLLGGVLLLNLAGVLMLHRALFGRRSFWPIGSGLVAYNSTFLLGFVNWQIGCGLAMPRRRQAG